MTYSVKEMFLTLQGEGSHSGRPAVFCRFAGCNLWTGLERDRATADCRFCDTEFVGTDGIGGGKFKTAGELGAAIAACWGRSTMENAFVVCTGGEPLLQLNTALIADLHDRGFEIAVETNGTIRCPEAVDWICVSPKGTSQLVQSSGDEIKFVFPQENLEPSQLENLDFKSWFIQPMDGPDLEKNTQRAVEFCIANPRWRLSVQTHKYIGIR